MMIILFDICEISYQVPLRLIWSIFDISSCVRFAKCCNYFSPPPSSESSLVHSKFVKTAVFNVGKIQLGNLEQRTIASVDSRNKNLNKQLVLPFSYMFSLGILPSGMFRK